MQAAAVTSREAAANRPARAGNTNKERQRRQRLVDLENEIVSLETDLNRISKALENPPADAGVVYQLGQEYERVQHDLDARMEEWAALSEELEGA